MSSSYESHNKDFLYELPLIIWFQNILAFRQWELVILRLFLVLSDVLLSANGIFLYCLCFDDEEVILFVSFHLVVDIGEDPVFDL